MFNIWQILTNTRMIMNRSKYLLFIFIILSSSSLLCAVIRMENISLLHEDVLDPDSARYLRQAKLIVEDGELPEVDHMRWAPIGVQINQRLTLFPTILAGLFKLLSWFIPSLTIEYFAILSPIIFSIFGGWLLYPLILKLTDEYTALLTVNISLISWPWVARTLSGYADRDAFVLCLAIASYYFYICSCQTSNLKKQWLLRFTSGFLMALIGLTWEGVGLLISVIVGVELIQFATKPTTKQEFYGYLLWILPIWIGLIFFTQTYWSRLFQPFSLLAFGAPTSLFFLMLASLIAPRFPSLREKLTFKDRYPLGLSLIFWEVIGATLVITVLSIHTKSVLSVLGSLWNNFLSPFERTRLTAAIAELQMQGTVDWIAWPGIFFVFTVAGVFLLARRLTECLQLNVWLSVALFELLLAGTVLTRLLSGHFLGEDTTFTNTIYVLSILVFLIGMGAIYLVAYQKRERPEKEKNQKFDFNSCFLLVWFFLMLFCARGAIRFEFFLVPVAIAVGSYALIVFFQWLVTGRTFDRWMWILFSTLIAWEFYAVSNSLGVFVESFIDNAKFNLTIVIGLTILLLGVGVFEVLKNISEKRLSRLILLPILTLCLAFIVGSPFAVSRGYAAASTSQAQQPSFLDSSMRQAFNWMEENLHQKAVIAASWEYGSFLNLHANRATIIDEEQISYWVHLMNRHVMLGQTEEEALEFLKTHHATHLLITQRAIKLLPMLSKLGSDENFDRRCALFHFGRHVENILIDPSGESCYRYLIPGSKATIDEPLQWEGEIYPVGGWQVSSVYLQVDRENQTFPRLTAALVEVEVGKQIFRLRPEAISINGQWIRQEGNVLPCTLLIHASSSNPSDWDVLYLSQRARQSLMIRLYLFNEASDFFKPIYPPTNGPSTNYEARLWEINYPPDVKPNPKYLLTQFVDSKLYRSWMKGGN